MPWLIDCANKNVDAKWLNEPASPEWGRSAKLKTAKQTNCFNSDHVRAQRFQSKHKALFDVEPNQVTPRILTKITERHTATQQVTLYKVKWT